jgi:hypothetical protein
MHTMSPNLGTGPTRPRGSVHWDGRTSASCTPGTLPECAHSSPSPGAGAGTGAWTRTGPRRRCSCPARSCAVVASAARSRDCSRCYLELLGRSRDRGATPDGSVGDARCAVCLWVEGASGAATAPSGAHELSSGRDVGTSGAPELNAPGTDNTAMWRLKPRRYRCVATGALLPVRAAVDVLRPRPSATPHRPHDVLGFVDLDGRRPSSARRVSLALVRRAVAHGRQRASRPGSGSARPGWTTTVGRAFSGPGV